MLIYSLAKKSKNSYKFQNYWLSLSHMKRPYNISPSLVLFVGLIILWIPWLGETLFYSKGEPREAIVAISMLQSGDWILPESCGSDIPYKPPFLAWLIAIFAKIFNFGVVNEFVARLPSAIAAIAMVMGGFFWARRERGERFALIMAIVLATSVEVYRAAVACRVDMVLTACMVGAIYLLYRIQATAAQGNARRYAAATLLLTCAVLTKGPVGALLPCFVMGIYYLLSGERFFPTLAKMLGLSIAACIIPAVWYYLAWLDGGDSFLALVWEENFERLTGTMPYESHVNPFWYNFQTIIVGMLPWTLLALFAIAAWRRFKRQPLKPAGRLALTVIVVVTLFYCIPASKRSVYLLPIYPFLAYGVASLAEGLKGTRICRFYTYIIGVVAIVAPLVAVATSDMPIAGFTMEKSPFWAFLLLVIPQISAAMWWLHRDKDDSIYGACIITTALLTCYGGAMMPVAVNRLSDKDDAARIEAIAGDSPIYVAGPDKIVANAYGISFYTNDRLRRLTDITKAVSLPVGTVLIFPKPADTLGLPDCYRLELLKSRLADTRRPAWIAIKEK